MQVRERERDGRMCANGTARSTANTATSDKRATRRNDADEEEKNRRSEAGKRRRRKRRMTMMGVEGRRGG